MSAQTNADCGCRSRVIKGDIFFCPLHREAEAILEALKTTALMLHATGKMLGCYTVEAFTDCDTPRCVENCAIIDRIEKVTA